MSTPHEPVEIDVDTLETSAGRLICLIKPTWISQKLNFKKLGVEENNVYYSIFPTSDEDEQHGVVVKVYRANSDVYTDHEKELRLVQQLIEQGIAPHILLTFNNGYFSEFVQGKIVDIKEQYSHQLIAKKLAEFHSIPLKFTDGSRLIDKLQQFINLFQKKDVKLQERVFEIKINFDLSAANGSFLDTLKYAVGLSPTHPFSLDQLEGQLKDTSLAELSTEIDFIRTTFDTHWSKHNLPMILCLNNMDTKNFLYDSKNKNISIIDFDHCLNDYFLIDIVSFFLELAKDDYEHNYPHHSIQKLFFIEYLKHSTLNLSTLFYDPLKPIDSELEHLCYLCGLLIAPVHLYWALWAFLQALLAKPASALGYINYGKLRLAQYQKHKQNFFLPLYQPGQNQ